MTACSSNLRQISISGTSYATDEKSQLPLPPIWFSKRPYHTRNAYASGEWRGMGLMHQKGYLSPSFYCPRQPPWFPVRKPLGQQRQMGPTCHRYCVCPCRVPLDSIQRHRCAGFLPYSTLDDYEPDKPVATDVITGLASHAHQQEQGWNGMFIDGHVSFVSGGEIVTRVISPVLPTTGRLLRPSPCLKCNKKQPNLPF